MGNPSEKVITPQAQILEEASRLFHDSAEQQPTAGWGIESFNSAADVFSQDDWRMFVPGVLQDNWHKLEPNLRAVAFISAMRSLTVLERSQDAIVSAAGIKPHADETAEIVMDAVQAVAGAIIDGAAHVAASVTSMSPSDVAEMISRGSEGN